MQLGSQNDIIRTLSTSRQRDMFGEDWYLSGVTTAQMSLGMEEENVITCLKHYGNIGNADEQTLHEMYLSSTETAIKKGAGAMSVMTAYGTVNGVPDCEDSYLLQDVLRNMWNYMGVVITDWGGNYDFTTDDGVTIETPNSSRNSPEVLQEALDNGLITWDYIDQQVTYILQALAECGYLNLVYVGRQGVAVDSNPPMLIELPDTVRGEARQRLLAEDNEIAIDMATKGAVLLKNENNALPLKDTEDTNIALIGLGSEYLIAGHQHECSFGALVGLSYSPADGLRDVMQHATVNNYVYEDIGGTAIPAEFLYRNEAATENGVVRTGTNGYGEEVNTVDANIDFTTNSITYRNAANGTAFEYGDQGHNYTWTTYLKAPETGTYSILVEGIAATSISGSIYMEQIQDDETVTMADVGIGAEGGDIGVGFYGNNSVVTTKTGMDIPSSGKYNGRYEAPQQNSCGGGSSGPRTYNQFDLEAGKVYRITVKADGAISDSYSYQRGVKDMQVRLAWITPSQKTANANDAIEAAGVENTKVILFAYEMDGGNDLPANQIAMMDAAIAKAEAAGNKVIIVLSSAVAVDITKYALNDTVEAILEMWLPGQGGGTAIANLLSGKSSPTGKLSVTWPINDDYDQRQINTEGRGVGYGYVSGGPTAGGVSTELKEGIYVGYKWYDAADLQDKVLYDFGYGLTYTSFDYEVESITPAAEGADTYGYDIAVKVTNTGSAPASEAPQVYIGAAENLEGAIYSPYDVAESWRYTYDEYADMTDEEGNSVVGAPTYADYFPVIDGIQQAKYQLVGYERTKVLNPGESDTVTIHVNQRALSYWDVDGELTTRSDGTKDKYSVIEGDRSFFIATSSDIDRDLIRKLTVDVAPAVSEEAADIVIGNVAAEPGEEVTVNVEIKNNKGIAGYLLYIECDTDYVTITDVQDGGAVFGGHYEIRETDSGYKVLWSNNANVISEGIIFSLTAKVADNAPNGVYPVTATYSDVNTANENSEMVAVNIVNGSITVQKIIPGDINGDGSVDNRDIIMIARYLVRLVEFTDTQKKAADFNRNGEINNVDLILMARFVVEAF